MLMEIGPAAAELRSLRQQRALQMAAAAAVAARAAGNRRVEGGSDSGVAADRLLDPAVVGYHPFGHLAFDVIFEASGQALVEVRATDGGGVRGGPIDMCLVNNRTDRPGRNFARSLKLRLCRRVLGRDRGRVAGWAARRAGVASRHGRK